MSVSILGGIAKGAVLAAPDSKFVRPTSALLKRKFFDSHQSMRGYSFYDICAGSGSVGFEALSREAEKVCFIEASGQILKTLKNNRDLLQKKFKFPGEVELVKSDCVKWLQSFELQSSDNIFFFDPPYESLELYKSFLEILRGRPGTCSKLVIEFCRQKTAKEEEAHLWLGKPDKIYRQGTSFLYVYDFS